MTASALLIEASQPHSCVATATDTSNTLAMLVQPDGDTLNALLERLDCDIGLVYDRGDLIDEVK